VFAPDKLTVQIDEAAAITIHLSIVAETTVIRDMLMRDNINNYFQQGFQRGYQDGYNSRYQYGTNINGGFNILATILQGILNIQRF